MQQEITMALSAANATLGLLKIAVVARDDAKTKAAVSDMAEKLSDANLGAATMSARLLDLHMQIEDLTAQLRDLKEAQRKRERYVLREVRPGAYAYAFEPLSGDATPAHYQCQICFDRGQNVLLVRSVSGRVLECHIDGQHNIPLATTDLGMA